MNVETSKFQAWVQAMRLRTLPLALSSTICGSFAAGDWLSVDKSILLMTALTTIFLQVNSNLANDYGDFGQGTDNDARIGPDRALQSGVISPSAMKIAIGIMSGLSFISGIILLSLTSLDILWKAVMLLAGVAAIYASVKYTAGRNPYGYRGLGDISVMAFFGILGVVGAYVCQTAHFEPLVLFPAFGIGAFSTGVLNINNTRDIENDRASGKITLAVKMGAKGARQYHILLLLFGWLCFGFYSWRSADAVSDLLYVLTLPLFIVNGVKMVAFKEARQLDPLLKQLALSTFLLAILFAIGLSI